MREVQYGNYNHSVRMTNKQQKVLLDTGVTRVHDGQARKFEDMYGNPFYLPMLDWVDLGEPKEITVTIEPGDLLNPSRTHSHPTSPLITSPAGAQSQRQ